MKINIFFLGIIIFFLNCSKIIAEEVIFNAEKLNIEDNGNKINAINSETTIEKNNIKINSKRVNYNKKTNIIIFTDKVYFHDKNENLIIESDKIKYDRKSEIINSYGPTKFILKNKFLLNSSDIFFDRIPQIIYGDGNSVLEDSEKNIFKLNDKFKFDVKNELIKSEKGHPYVRSFKWIFDLSNKPQMFFNKWSLFRYVFKICDTSKPFYEFGVWTGNSFNFIIQNIKKGYGFDTFTGLPENWQVGNKIEKAGSYSNSNKIPEIKGGKFIKGEFKKTLPNFFSKSRSVASLINIDVDLYSSTICVLESVRNIVDKDTIIIFDEFLINDTWEQDEAKALFDFCSKYKYKYEVIAYSFFSKQVAIKLIKI